MKRTVYFISDGTGITAEAMGHSLLTQFEDITFDTVTCPYIDTLEKAEQTVHRINQTHQELGSRPLIFATLVNTEIRQLIATSHGMLLDFFNMFIEPLEKELQIPSSHNIGKTHGLQNYEAYKHRIDAVNFALTNDDGANVHNYDDADLILIGVSRCGKTPTCLYLALQFGIYAANYPITEDDMTQVQLPKCLQAHRKKIFGLTITSERLQAIRQERRPNSDYSARAQCDKEIRHTENLFRTMQIPFISTTTRSIEEISTTILNTLGLARHLF